MAETAPLAQASAPGKVILFGEHAVVHKKLAISTCLSLRTRVAVTATPAADAADARIVLAMTDLGIQASFARARVFSNDNDYHASDVKAPAPPSAAHMAFLEGLIEETLQHDATVAKDESLARKALQPILFVLTALVTPDSIAAHAASDLHFHVSSNIPVSAGMGSSAAFSVSCTAVCLQLRGALAVGKPVLSEEEKHLVNDWAFESEKLIHGKPSGIDNSVSTFGGIVSFQSGKVAHATPQHTLDIVMVDTRKPHDTRALVAGVGERLRALPTVMEPLLDSVHAIAVRGEALLEGTDAAALAATMPVLIDMNHGLLNAMGVGDKTLDDVVRVAHKHGLAAKMTGAGGGGSAFVLCNGDDAAAKAAQDELDTLEFDGLKYKTYKAEIAGVGVSLV